MSVDQWYNIILYAVSKNGTQGYVSPEDFNNVLMPVAQSGYVDYLLGQYQQYRQNRPISVVQFSGNERVRDSISPLIYNIVLPINSTTGIASFPSDYEYIDAMWSLYNIYDIRFTQQDQLANMYRSAIDEVSENPIYVIQQEGFHFYPSTPYGYSSSYMSYVRKPPPITWGYYLDGNEQPIYDPLTSQQPIWSDSDSYNIIVRALQLVGVNLSVPQVVQYAEQIKRGGQ
jgi:hypothetical protein